MSGLYCRRTVLLDAEACEGVGEGMAMFDKELKFELWLLSTQSIIYILQGTLVLTWERLVRGRG